MKQVGKMDKAGGCWKVASESWVALEILGQAFCGASLVRNAGR